MNHSFLPALDATQCRYTFPNGVVCSREILAHTSVAECEACGAKADCEIYDTANTLMCWNCKDKEVQSLMDKVESSAVENAGIIALSIVERALHTFGREAKELGRITLRKDIFNSEISSFVELRNSIDSDETIAAGAKDFAFHSALANRKAHYNSIIYNKENELLEINQRNLATTHTLRLLANTVSAKVREQIRKNDALYQPAVPKTAISKLNRDKVKMSPLERIVQQVALYNNWSIEKARAEVAKNPSLMGTDKPLTKE